MFKFYSLFDIPRFSFNTSLAPILQQYDSVVSIIWKFPEFASLVPEEVLTDESFLLTHVKENEAALNFLMSL